MNFFDQYYETQAGNGIAGFSGVKYQKGFGFFGRLLSGAVMPFLRFLGKNALRVGANIGKDLAESEDFSLDKLKSSAKTRMKEGATDMLKSGAQHILSGNGVKTEKSSRKRKKVIKVTRPKTNKTNKKKQNKKKSEKKETTKKKTQRKRNKKSKKSNSFLE